VRSQKPEGPGSQDWFLPAMSRERPLRDCLQNVQRLGEQRLSFVRALSTNLCAYAGKSGDSLTELRRRLKEFEDTLSFRLPLLSAERSGAWFRAFNSHGVGPFPPALLTEPVMAPHPASSIPELRRALQKAFATRRVGVLPFSPATPSLWLHLLSLNQALEQVIVLPPPYADLRLDTAEAALAPELASDMLLSFLREVAASANAARATLDGLFGMLWESSCAFWRHYGAEAALPRSAAATSRPQRRQPSPAHDKAQDFRDKAQDMRSQFRERRRTLGPKPPYNLSDLTALRCMELETMPSRPQLRQRYLELARRLHPDLEGGNEDGFKALGRAYSHLSRRLSDPGP